MSTSIHCKTNIYLPVELATIISEDAHVNGMNISKFVSFKLLDGFQILSKFSNYDNLLESEKYRSVLQSFNPPKPGPKSSDISGVPIEKKLITFRFSEEVISGINRFGKFFNLNNSCVTELILRIVYSSNFNGMPLKSILFSEYDIYLLRSLMHKTGADSVAALLNACQYKEPVEAIKKWLE